MVNNNLKKQKPIQIFSNDNEFFGANVIKSQVKLNILEMLKNHEMEFDEIVTNVGKSKSTVSVHLKSLRENNIISYRLDPNDNRKKIFFLNSKFIGAVNEPEKKELTECQIDFLVDNIIDSKNFEFLFLFLHTLKSKLIQEGINIDPILHETGLQMGYALYNKLKDKDITKFLENIKNYWKINGMGTVSYENDPLLKITVTDCAECELLPKTGKPACYLDSGIFEALFSSHFNQKVNVVEINCYTMGDEKCVFEIEQI